MHERYDFLIADVHLQHFVSLQKLEALEASVADLQHAMRSATPSTSIEVMLSFPPTSFLHAALHCATSCLPSSRSLRTQKKKVSKTDLRPSPSPHVKNQTQSSHPAASAYAASKPPISRSCAACSQRTGNPCVSTSRTSLCQQQHHHHHHHHHPLPPSPPLPRRMHWLLRSHGCYERAYRRWSFRSLSFLPLLHHLLALPLHSTTASQLQPRRRRAAAVVVIGQNDPMHCPWEVGHSGGSPSLSCPALRKLSGSCESGGGKVEEKWKGRR